MQPDHGRDLHDLAIAALARDDLDAALTHASEAVSADAGNIGYRETLARVHYRMGHLPAVISIYEAIVREQPNHLPALKKLARLLLENWQFDRAVAVIAQGLALDDADEALLSMRVFALHEQGHGDDARAVAIAASTRHPESLSFAMDARLLLPMIYSGAADLAASRQRYASGLEELQASLPQWRSSAEQVLTLERSNFLLAYQGQNDRELQQRYAGFIGQLVATAAPELTGELPLQFDGGRRLRIGFVSKWFYASTAGSYFERWITQLDAARFERFVYYTGQGEDELTRRIESGCEHFTRLQQGPRADGARIRADRLDVLIHPEVGMSTGSYLLAAMRLAPVQMAAWGHPVTTGSEQIDYYLTCGDMEPENYADHYSEKVIRLGGIGVDIAMPAMGKPLDRKSLGLPPDGNLYFCPQSLFKIHPDMDEVFLKILQSDRRAVLVFFQAGSRAITMAFADRLGRCLEGAGIQARGQIKFLPRLGGDRFRSALALADVMLDTLHWSGGGTSLDALAAGVPVVSLPGAFMRGRQTATMLRSMRMEDLIVGDVDHYVAKAMELATDRGINAAVRERIEAGRSSVFGQGQANREFADAVYAAVLGHGQR